MSVKRSYGGGFVFILAVTLLLCSSYVLAVAPVRSSSPGASSGDSVRTSNGAKKRAASVPARYRVFSLRHISAEQGRKYLEQARVGTVSQLPGANTLLVTAQPRELIKATAILHLVDAKEQFVIKALFPASAANELPGNEQIAAEVGNISIGSFSNRPGAAASKAIIDIHGDVVVAVAPVSQMERIVSAIERLQERGKREAVRAVELGKAVEPNEPIGLKAEEAVKAELKRIAASIEPGGIADATDGESKELFNKLLRTLAEAEKRAAEQARQVSRPNEPGAAAAVPDANVPGKLPAGPKPALEAAPERAKQPEEVGLAAILKRLAALEATIKGEVAREEAAVKIEHPDEAAEAIVAFRSYEPELIVDGDEMLEVDLPEKLDIIVLLDLVGKYLHLDYMYDEKRVLGEVSLKFQGPIKVKDLYPLLESVLKFKGFVMTRGNGNLVIIELASDTMNIDPLLLTDQRQVQIGDVVITRVFKLKHIDTTSANNLLTGMRLGAAITPIAETGTLFVTGYAHRMARIEELLSMIDKPGKPKKFRSRQLRYTMAETLAPKIKTLAEELGTISITVAAARAVPPRPSAPRPGESAAARRAREARERAAAVRGRAAAAPQPTPAKPTVYLDADERTNRILMIGLEEQLAVIEELIDTLDVAQQDLRTLRVYEIQHVDAEEVQKKLQEFGIISTVRTTTPSRISTGARPTPPRTGAARSSTTTTTAESLVEEPQVVVIESINSLLVNATDEQHIRIATIIGYVDSEAIEEVIPYKIYSLENQDPEDLAGVLNQLIQETVKDKEGKITEVIKKKEDIIIIPDKNTFSLIVYASKKNQDWIKKLIKDLDKRRPQVLIDVSLVEITREDQFEYDLNIIANAKHSVIGNIAISGSGLPKAFSTTQLEGGWNLGDPGGSIQGFYAEDKIQALLTAMQKKEYGRILAQPKVLVNDNEEGVIKTTEKTHVAETTTSYPSQGTTGGVLNPIYTTTYTPYEAKIELSITPNISEGDLLRLEINMLREDFERVTDMPPDYTTSNITTIVTVPDGSTIILGGLTKLKQKKAGYKVPLLGDIPLIGGLFRTIDNRDEASKLYIFVKANILRPDETVGLAQLQKISDENKALFEEAERKFQKEEDWPGIEPEPIEPVRILESSGY